MSDKKRNCALGVVNFGSLQAFNEYTNTVSWVRVARTCSFAIAPAFMVMMLIDLMPLAPVKDGWAANWVLWVRLFFTGIFSSNAICTIFRTSAPAAQLSTNSIVFTAVGSSCGFVFSLIALAKFWIFPVPFSIFVGGPIVSLCTLVCISFAIGWKNIRTSKVLRDQLAPLRKFINAQTIMVFAYPAYNAGFITLSGMTQIAFILVLPTIKYFMKWLLKRIGNRTAATNVLAMTTVDFFEAMYLFRCMQSAGSIECGLALISMDLVQNVIHLHALYKKVRVLEENLSTDTRKLDGRNLVRSLIQFPQPSVILRFNCPRLSGNTVSPLSINAKTPLACDQPVSTNELSDTVDDFFLECQEVLFVEYIECIAPLFYVLYSTILFHLPNAKYYPEMQNMTIGTLNTLLGNIAIYAGLECLSLVYMHLLLKWRFNLSAMHLLAFMLESEREVIQGAFIRWAVLNMQYTLVHYGMDFSFRFAWVHSA